MIVRRGSPLALVLALFFQFFFAPCTLADGPHLGGHLKSLNIYLYDVDDLQGVVQANLKERHKEAAKAEVIIAEEVLQFQAWLATLDVV